MAAKNKDANAVMEFFNTKIKEERFNIYHSDNGKVFCAIFSKTLILKRIEERGRQNAVSKNENFVLMTLSIF